jgi:predicted RNA methylase
MIVGCASTPPTDPNYQPARGQSGKDVIWIPTPPELVEKMLTMAKVTPQDRVYDLGAGDGIIAIAAAQKFKANAVGIEYNPDMLRLPGARWPRLACRTRCASSRATFSKKISALPT